VQPHQNQPLEPHLLRILQRQAGWISRSRPVVLATLSFFLLMSLRHVCTAHERATRFPVVIGNREDVRMSWYSTRSKVVVLATLAAYSAVGDVRRFHGRVASFQACRGAWCNGNILIRILELSLVFLKTDKCDAHSFCSFPSLSMLVFNVKQHVPGYAISILSTPHPYSPAKLNYQFAKACSVLHKRAACLR
jgi:hypothetical protein